MKKKSAVKHCTGNLKIWKKFPAMLGFDGYFPAVQPIVEISRSFLKNCKKSGLKLSTGN